MNTKKYVKTKTKVKKIKQEKKKHLSKKNTKVKKKKRATHHYINTPPHNLKHLKGGTHLPGSYFGTPNDVYSTNPNTGLEPHAYGETVAVSYGVPNGNSTGPNLHVFPNSSGAQTGGCGSCGVQVGMMAGGNSCGAHPVPTKGMKGGYRK